MLEMFMYAIGIMYTPGPVNLLGLNLGLNKKLKETWGYYLGVGTAMFILLMVYGYTGERLIKKEYLFYISIIGTVYIVYLAYKLVKANIQVKETTNVRTVAFKDGFLMQLFNPKATLATLPIATINFPVNNITGIKITVMALLMGLVMASCAPLSYAIAGIFASNFIKKDGVLKVFNMLMAAILLYVAFGIFMDYVYLVYMGVSAY